MKLNEEKMSLCLFVVSIDDNRQSHHPITDIPRLV